MEHHQRIAIGADGHIGMFAGIPDVVERAGGLAAGRSRTVKQSQLILPERPGFGKGDERAAIGQDIDAGADQIAGSLIQNRLGGC